MRARSKLDPQLVKIKARASHLKRAYGITTEQYDALLAKQNGCCAICGKHHTEFKKALSVDHDHKTGEIFGLLCTFDNHRFVGRVRDPNRYHRAAEYLTKGTGWFVPEKKKKRK